MSEFDWQLFEALLSDYGLTDGEQRDAAILDLHERVEALESQQSFSTAAEKATSALNDKERETLALRIEKGNDKLQKRIMKLKHERYDLQAKVDEFVAWAKTNDSLSMMAARDEVLDKLRELGLVRDDGEPDENTNNK